MEIEPGTTGPTISSTRFTVTMPELRQKRLTSLIHTVLAVRVRAGGTARSNQGCSDAQLDTVTGSQAFGISLTQLINTYWLSNAGPELTTNSLGTPSTQVCYQIQPPPNPKMTCAFVLDAPATETTSVEIIVCHRGWLAAIITASAVIIAATVLHVATVLDRKFGDLLFNMSAIVRNDAHIAPMQISSTIEDADLSRLLRRMEVRLDDIRPTNDVGHIGIGTLAGGRKADRLRKGRLYH